MADSFEDRFLHGPAAKGQASRKRVTEVPPEYMGDVVVAAAYDSAVRRGDVFEAELRQQKLEAWMRGDLKTADRIAALIGDSLPSEHELADLRSGT